MRKTSLLPQNGHSIEGSITIERTVSEVFAFYRDFRNLPRFLGDVMAVEQTSPVTYRWTIQGPLRLQANWAIRVSEEHANELIRYETAAPPGLRTYWEIYFEPASTDGSTKVREVLKAPLGSLGRAALALVGKFPSAEVTANLRRLKQVIETGRVTDVSYSIPDKFRT
jgi:uncharacterized membrane protein